MEESGQLHFITYNHTQIFKKGPQSLVLNILFADRHTDKQMIPHIKL